MSASDIPSAILLASVAAVTDYNPSTIAAVFAAVYLVFEILGVASAIHAVMSVRTSQGAVAWALGLVSMPLLAVPLYWVFGRSKFRGYVRARRLDDKDVQQTIDQVLQSVQPYQVNLGQVLGEARVLEQLGDMPFTRGNDIQLLIDGPATFESIFSAIEAAEVYVLVEFFIVHADDLGTELQKSLIDKARHGCRVYFLYDEVGSSKLPKSYLAALVAAGVQVSAMNTTGGGLWNRFQLNFRNHRKTVVVDGKVALVGGHNVGDEYVHRHQRLTPWRDTHVRFEGPAVLAAQWAFVEDWHWATKGYPHVRWEPWISPASDKTMFVLPSGPADEFETCGLFFTHAINSASRRIWIASPYFVPDEGIINALKLAAMRGVDVRVLIPGLADKWFIKLAAMSYVPPVTAAGVKMYEFSPGFLHQKVVLIDDAVTSIGTANFDNRSFRLNFETSVVTIDRGFTAEVEAMLDRDFETSKRLDASDLVNRSIAFKVGARVARLFSPLL